MSAAHEFDPLFDRYKAASLAHLRVLAKRLELRNNVGWDQAYYAAVEASETEIGTAQWELDSARSAYLGSPPRSR